MIDKVIPLNNNLKEKVKETSYKMVFSIIIIIVTIIIAKIVRNNFLNRIVEKDNTNNKIFYSVLASFFYHFILITGIILALVNLGYQLSTIFIVIGSIGFAIALAMQSSISQVVSGFLILFFNYFNIGDYINSNNVTGYVTEFNLLTTTIKDTAGLKIILSNSSITANTFTNYTTNKYVIFKLFITVSANNSIDYSILLNNIKTAIINNCKYVTDKSKVSAVIYDIQGSGTVIMVNIPIESIYYLPAGYDARLVVRKVLSDDNILLLDNSYPQSGGSRYS